MAAMASYLFSIISSRLGAQDPAHLFLAPPHPHPGWGRTPERCLELGIQKKIPRYCFKMDPQNSDPLSSSTMLHVMHKSSYLYPQTDLMEFLVRPKSSWILESTVLSAACLSTFWLLSISSSNLTSQVIINHHVLCHFASVFSTANQRLLSRFLLSFNVFVHYI